MTKNIYISDLTNHVGQEITITGWVNNIRDLGKIIFIDLRDSTGRVQVVCSELTGVGLEDIVTITGLVKERQLRNPEVGLVPVEIDLNNISIESKSDTPPFPIFTDGHDIDQSLRLTYRYLDLRRSRLAEMLRTRHKFIQAIREYFYQANFLEVETPLLSKTTPEGARDFLVPSRQQKGKFYALPQSPQQYKQLLMVAGQQRYFQIAKCLRDEDLRSDRSFEHSQLDLELSSATQDDIFTLMENMWQSVGEKLNLKIPNLPFPRFKYDEAIEKFGSDKFDLRTDAEKESGVLSFAWVTDFPLFEKKESGWTFMHNPFTAPAPEDEEKVLNGTAEGVRSQQFDLVCNGFELGSGSIRMTKPDLMRSAFKIMGYDDESIENNFGHLIKAYEYGSLIHGGIGMGIERPLMIILGEQNLTEVIAFPQTYAGNTSVMDAPSVISEETLMEHGLQLLDKDK